MSVMIINNKGYVGSSITVINNKVFVDGVDVTPDAKTIDINVQGDLQTLTVDACNIVNVEGSVGSLQTTSGGVSCGNVETFVQTTSGDVECREVKGYVKTVSGDIHAETILGSVTTVSGAIHH